jgi:nanoRNase/pAp phosphatase (c-di-AMP/oligoRNAs hydrolase)
MIYITAGELYTDIDAFSCAIAYSYLLNQKGIENKVYLPGVLNASVTNTVKSWNLKFETQIQVKQEDKFIIVDASESSHIAKPANDNNIIEVFDHRYGFADHYNNLLGDKSKIEMVGACATLIWEEYKKQNIEIDSLNANLLILAIVSNTLDFKSSVTTPRDLKSFEELLQFIDMPLNWKENYFKEQSEYIEKNPKQAVLEDTKNISSDLVFAQIELWSGYEFLNKNKLEIKEALESLDNPKWMISIPSISEGVNYIYTESDYIKDLLKKIIEIDFNGDIGKTSKLWLRKEIREKILKLNML